MEGIDFKRGGLDFFKKYRYVLLIFLIGLFLMLMPQQKTQEPVMKPAEQPTEPSLEESLEAILSKIDGAGKTEVLLTQAMGEQIMYQTNEDASETDMSESIRKDTVMIVGEGRDETGLIRRIDPPVYLGAVVLCQGGDNPHIRLSIVEAVSNATGLTTDRITVLKMK